MTSGTHSSSCSVAKERRPVAPGLTTWVIPGSGTAKAGASVRSAAHRCDSQPPSLTTRLVETRSSLADYLRDTHRGNPGCGMAPPGTNDVQPSAHGPGRMQV